MDKKFAFESEEVSIAFYTLAGLGDAVIARKVFDAIIELAPDCVIDFYCVSPAHFSFAKAFYGDSKNLNRLINQEEYLANKEKYDLALYVGGCHVILFDWSNAQRLQAMAPKLWECLVKIDIYNRQNVHAIGDWRLAVALRNMISARILNKDCYSFLSYDGALPIHDDKIKLSFATEYKLSFERLKLGNYITLYTDIAEKNKFNPKVKTWPVKYFVEYVARMKKYLPQIEIVQCGGGDDVKIDNADRHFMGVDLELTKYILANSLLHVGCEGGLIHLATQLGTKCLTLFGPTDVHYYGYDRNINVVSEVCSPCMFLQGDGNLRTCMRGNKEPPCMLSITPRQVFEITRNYLNRLDLKNNA